MKITTKMILEKYPCEEWDKKRIKKYIGRGKSLSDILAISGVKASDKIWCATRFLPDNVNREFAIWCARRCKTNIKEITNYIDVIEKFYEGKATPAELKTAQKAADRAANTPEAHNHIAVCWAAQRAPQRVAQRAAYWAANMIDGASAPYWAVCRAEQVKERNAQLKKLKELIAEAEK